MDDPRNKPNLTKAFTLVFEGDIRRFKLNPLTTETPWGIPYAVAMGDVLEKLSELEGVVEHYLHDGNLQTFQDRERFRKAARAILDTATGKPRNRVTRPFDSSASKPGPESRSWT